jgi:hypothetical protein
MLASGREISLQRLNSDEGCAARDYSSNTTFNHSCIAILESVRKERMAENTAIFDFELDRNDAAAIAALDQKASSFFEHRDPVSEVDILARLCLIIRWNKIVQHPRHGARPTYRQPEGRP